MRGGRGQRGFDAEMIESATSESNSSTVGSQPNSSSSVTLAPLGSVPTMCITCRIDEQGMFQKLK